MKRTNKSIKTISIFLCILMAFLLPVQVCADVTGNEEEELTADFSNISSDGEEVGNIVSEITGERTEYSKTFLLDDGTKMLAQYSEPVHYKNDNGKWVQYNNTLVESNESSMSTSDEATKITEFTNKKSDKNITLSKTAHSDRLVDIVDGKYSISWSYKHTDNSSIKVVNDNEKLKGNDKFTTIKSLSSQVVYSDIYKDVDLQYNVSSSGLKENIILNNADAQNEFDITYDIGSLNPRQKDENTITLYDKRKAVYTITAPYMVDAKGNASTKLKLEIISHKGRKLNAKITADSSFITSSDRRFPITVDPQVSTTLNSGFSYEGYVGSNKTYNPPYYLASNAYCRWKINTLPSIDESQVITKATFNYSISSISETSSNNSPIIVNLHNYTSASPYYNSKVEDYCAVTSASDRLEFDITKLMRDWVDGITTNNGFVLEAKETIGTRQLTISPGDKSHSYPTYTVVYKDFAGTEDSMSYHTVSAGSKAQVSVNDYLGNLVVSQNLYESKAARMPISLSATYNSFDYDTNYTESMMGYGWKFSFNQYIKTTNATLQNAGYDYVYIDEERTKHYLKETSSGSNKWEDEEDLGLTLKFKDGFGLLNDGSQTKKFRMPSEGGHLMYIYENDKPNNHIGYGRASDGTVQYMYDSTNSTVASFSTTTINGQKYISTINLPKSKKIYLTHALSNGKVLLTKVTMPDGSISQYFYSNSGMLNSVKYLGQENETDKDGQAVTLQYNSNGQVTNISEISTEGNTGNSLTYQYNNDNTTQVTDIKGRSETYTFDNEGNRISTLNANGFISTDGGSGLTASSGADSFTKNYITESSEFSTIRSGNYYYKIENEASRGGVCEVDNSSDNQYFGETAIRIYNEKMESDSPYYTSVAHDFVGDTFKGESVTFSAYVKTSEIDKDENKSVSGAVLTIRCYDSNHRITKTENSFGIGGTEPWQRISVTAEVPENTMTVQVTCNVRHATGTAWFDCLQLEKGKSTNDYNALQNTNFETQKYWKDEDNEPISVSNNTATILGEPGKITANTVNRNNDGLISSGASLSEETSVTTVTETEPYGYVSTYDDYGNETKTMQGHVVRTIRKTYDTSGLIETGSSTDEEENNYIKQKYIYQSVNVKKSGISFNFTGQVKAKSVPITSSERTFGLAVNIYYQDSDGTVITTPEKHYQEFNSCITSKQSVSMSVSPEKSNIIDYIDFAFVYGYNSNSMTVYNASLNILHQKVEEESEDNNQAGDSENAGEDNLIDEEVISEKVVTSEPYIQTDTIYDSTGNYVLAEKDEFGNTTQYIYDGNEDKTSITDNDGNIIAITNTNGNSVVIKDGNENAVNYSYDDADNVTSISSGNAYNNYTYDYLGNVSLITHNNFSYQFNHNQYNKLIETKVGSKQIVTNEYDSNYGNLTRTTYGNGDYIEYEYDLYDNITEISSDDGIIATYEYNKKGLISKSVDNESGETTYYYYDFNGALQGQYVQGENGDLTKYVGENENGDEVEKVSVGNKSRTITIGTDNNGKSFVDYDGLRSESETDGFGRTTSISSYNGTVTNGELVTSFEYANVDNTRTSNTVKKMTQTYDTEELAEYEYSYDRNGNITEIKTNGTLTNKYTYDSLNQLVEEYNYQKSKYIKYTYDNGGNIKKTETSSLSSTGSVGDIVESIDYTYGDSVWKDKLTKYGTYNITYDGIGNPLNYRNGMTFSWKNGRWLASTTLSDNTTVTYQYNANGMRTCKNVSGTKTYYYYDENNNLAGLTKGSNTMFFYYDGDNSPISFRYNDDMYYYVKNLQGDITKIVNASGVVYGTYTYDAWGNIISSSGDPFVSRTNPLRYRGYVYDTESGLYYLQSRYYDPYTSRFINADDTEVLDTTGTVLSVNIFTYCENNPVNNVDYNGLKAKGDFEHYVKRRWKKTSFGDKIIKISIKKNNISIRARVNITGSLKNKKIKDNGKQETYGKLIQKGMKKYWKGDFQLFGYKVRLSTNITVGKDNALSINAVDKKEISNVRYDSPWCIGDYGKMTIYRGYKGNSTNYSAEDFKRVSAHEFGHLLGVDDLYNKPQKVRDKFCCRHRYGIMCHEFEAKSNNSHELKRVILAFAQNRHQTWA